MPPKAEPVLRRLVKRIVVLDSGCWIWTGYRFTKTGYGAMKIDGKLRLVHRVSYELFRGPIPEGLALDHLCRERLCVNPTHLEATTIAENCRRGKGAKLTRDDVAAIEAAVGETNRALAERFGVSRAHISHLRRGDRKYWKEH